MSRPHCRTVIFLGGIEVRLPAVWLVLSTVGLVPFTAGGDELAGRDVDIQELVAALEADDLSANEIRRDRFLTRVSISWISGPSRPATTMKRLETALGRTDDGWAMVQTAIVANEPLNEELKRRSIAVRNVVAATLDDNAIITILTG